MKLGPVPCQGCREPVRWNGFRWIGANRKRHACTTCGTYMPQARERCARAAGHGTPHRSRYAMDNALRAKTGRAA